MGEILDLDQTGDVRHIDRRASAAADTLPDPTGRTEADRLAHRRDVKERLAKRAILEQRCRVMRSDMARIMGEIDAAANEHSAKTAELQDELQELEDRALARITSRKPADAKERKRRAEIVRAIADENAKLQRITDDCRRRRFALQQKLNKIFRESCSYGTENELTIWGAASPELFGRMFVCQRREKLHDMRVKAAREQLALHRDPDQRRLRPYLNARHKRQWEAELADAEAALVEARQEAKETRQQMIDE
jgi:hypothetical protein